ncbi:hypothetical protein [Geothrix sp. 21YS21S-2]|uniref:hypothetical protein n=1 Tax=Geothrix sp. 21YS21S-2 TaxID=3068893 RepID=UPI0027BAF361|nr:hypothetical protein [Geothrix sp. 21YS21S-2]
MSEGFPLPWARPFQVGLRTAHIMAMGLVLGGVALGAGHGRLKASIAATVVSGVLLFALDLAKGTTVIYQGSGVAVLLKLALLGLGNLVPQQRLGWYLAATAVASIGSHMPGNWRHFSLIHGKVIRH